jgi:hypothetical protein
LGVISNLIFGGGDLPSGNENSLQFRINVPFLPEVSLVLLTPILKIPVGETEWSSPEKVDSRRLSCCDRR